MKEELIELSELGNRSIPEWLKSLSDQDFARLAMTGFSNPARIQEQVLKQIIETSYNTEFGRKYNFRDIHTIDDFQNRVPVCEWKDVEPYAERMADGETDILFPGLPKIFVLTSGTTGNKFKMIPESELGSVAKRVVLRFRRFHLIRNLTNFNRNGFVLPLSTISFSPPTKAGIPVGFASGISLNQSMGENQILPSAFPLDVLSIKNTNSRDYMLLRFALQNRNVIAVVGNNAGRFRQLVEFASQHADEIINDIENGKINSALEIEHQVREMIKPLLAPDPKRAAELRQILKETGDLLPKDYWPSLQMMTFWLSASVGHNIKDVIPLVSEKALFFDVGYGSSELRINIPSQPSNAAGTLSVYTAFFEFIPEDGGNPLLAHQLEDGKMYELVVTTWSGLFRYNMKDMIKVEGFTGNTPNVVFAYKSGEILNLANEKIPASLVANSIRQVAERMEIDILQIQVYPDQDAQKYFCYIETSSVSSSFDVEKYAEMAHLLLSENSIAYDIMCNHQKMIHPLQIVEMKKGWQDSLYAERIMKTGSSAQVKLPVMIREKPETKWIQ
jgi:hypothetical protein